MRLGIFRRLGYYLPVDRKSLVEPAGGGIEISQDRTAFGFVFVHFSQDVVGLFGFIEPPVDEIEAGEDETCFTVVPVGLDRLLKLSLGIVRTVNLNEKLSVLIVRQCRGA